MVVRTTTLLYIINIQATTLTRTAQCLNYSTITNYFQRLTLESWYINLQQTPPKRCQQLPARYKGLIHDETKTVERTSNRPT